MRQGQMRQGQMRRIVLLTGFESFNAHLYRQAAQQACLRVPDLEIHVFNDRDLVTDPSRVEAALEGADVFFGSLLFDYDQVMWLRDRLTEIPIRLVFESAIELMAMTRLGKFALGDQPKGMPKPVKLILAQFSKSREEDKLAGYLKFLKTGPKLLKYIPIGKVQDLRNWLIIYGYWNAGGSDNVATLFECLAQQYLGMTVGEIADVIETPDMGLLHPDYPGYFTSPRAYMDWYRDRFPNTNQGDDRPVIGLLFYRKHVISRLPYIPQLIRAFDAAGLIPLPIFINGVEGHVAVRDWMTSREEQAQRSQGIFAIDSLSDQAVCVEAIVSTIGFPLVGGPAGSMEAGRQVEVATQILQVKNVPYLIAAPLLIQDIHSWTRQGIGGLQSVVLYALPELDGAIDTIALGGLVGEQIYLIPDRVNRLTDRVKAWVNLRRQPVSERTIAILVYGFPPGYGAIGTAALLNVGKSLLNVLQALQSEGYQVGELPETGEEILQQVKVADQASRSPTIVNARTLEDWLGYWRTQKVTKNWKSLTDSGIKTLGDEYLLGGVRFGNVWIGVQPPLGIDGDPMRLLFERDLTPHPQYIAFYQWMARSLQADAMIHFGMHGTVEWLPGSPLGNTGYSWSDYLLGNLPNFYLYAANNPSESMLAKRRGYGVLISHNVPPYGRAGLYKELLTLRDLIAEFRENPIANIGLRESIAQAIANLGIQADCPFEEARQLGIAFSVETIKLFSPEAFRRYVVTVYDYLQVLENRLFSSGLHELGAAPDAAMLRSYLDAYLGDALPDSMIAAIAEGTDRATLFSQFPISPDQESQLDTALLLRDRLAQTPEEITHLLRGLKGGYIPPAPGGDLLRDGPGVLPTGRNIHALDPYRMPSPAAYERGRAIARQILAQHQAERGEGTYPETVAVMLWGLDAIKTKGESLGIVLELVGAEPIKEGTGRIVRYELRPLAELDHPRIDVLANLSGIFRDSFLHVIELLDDLFHRAAESDEPIAQNYIRKHSLELRSRGVENSSARLFSNPAGDYGSLVTDQVVAANWETGTELGQTWERRNAFSFGRQDKGQARPEVLQALLQTTDRIIQEIDSVEYGLTDIQEYYGNTGGLKRAAESQQGGKGVTASFVESFAQDATPRRAEDLLRLEYRTKLLNPKWATAMATQGSGGAYEISQRMTALLGWGGTIGFRDDWVYDQAAATYALDAAMANHLRQVNPEAFRNIVGRMLEAHGREFWDTDAETLETLRQLYDRTDDQLEGITSNELVHETV